MTDILNNIDNKKVCVLGMGISNRPLIKFLYTKGARKIWVLDKSDSEETHIKAKALREEGVNFTSCFGENYLEALKTENFDIVFKTPIVRYDLPELIYAGEHGAVVTSEMEVFLNLCPAKIYAVTGSDGKTTTTTLIYKFLDSYCKRRGGGRAWVGGNIGTPLLPYIDEIRPDDFVIVELSSFQLMNMKAKADVSVITNISPNHLDVHKSYEEYIAAKKNIFLYGDRECITVLNRDNKVTYGLGKEVPGHIRWFSRKQDTEQGDQHPYGMPFDKGHRPGRQLFRGDCRFFGGPCPGLGGLPCLFRILALDAPLLQMPGEGAALHFQVLLHGRAVMVIRRGLDMLCLGFSDGLLRMLPDGLFCVA